MGGAIPSRDHTSSAFQTQSEQAKFPRGGADLTSAVSVSSAQQNQPGTSTLITAVQRFAVYLSEASSMLECQATCKAL